MRRLRKLSQEELAALIGRSVDAVSAIERGKSLPNYETLERLSKSLGVPVRDFFEDDPDISDDKIAVIAEITDRLRRFNIKQLRLASETIASIERNST